MFASLDPLTIDDSAPVPLIDASLLHSPSVTSNAYLVNSGYSMRLITDGVLHVGGSDVSQSSSSYDAGQIDLTDLFDNEVPYAIAATGTTVTVQRWAQGLKKAIDTLIDSVGFGENGFGFGGFGQ